MQFIDAIIILAYFAGIFAIGAFFSNQQKSLKDFFQGSRNIPWWAAMCSGIATIVSGISYLGGPGLAFSTNFNWQQYRLAVPFALLILCGLMLPLFHRLGVYSIYEYLERRFDSRTRGLAAFSFLLLKSGYLAVVIYAPSLVIAEAVEVAPIVIIVATGIGTALYTLMGGIKAVIWTDTAQLLIFVAGIFVTLALIISRVDGGLGEIVRVADAAGRLDFFNFSPSLTETYTFWSCVIGGTIMLVSQFGSDQAEIQRYLTTRSPRQANVAMIASHVGLVVVGLSLFFIGTALFGYYSEFPAKAGLAAAPNRVFAKFIIEEMPPGLRGLLVAGVLAASMSTISSVLNSLATVTMADILPRLAGQHVALRNARWLSLGFGVLTTVAACFADRMGNLLDASNRIINLFGGSLVGVFLLGILSKRATAAGGFWGLLIGLTGVLILQATTKVSFMWFGPFSATLAILSGLLISAWSPRAGEAAVVDAATLKEPAAPRR